MKPIVTPHTAKMLQELGFYEPCDHLYDGDILESTHRYINNEEGYYAAPYVLDAWWWLQQNTKFRIEPSHYATPDKWSCEYYYDGQTMTYYGKLQEDVAAAISDCLHYIAENEYYK